MSLRIVARVFFERAENRATIPPELSNCPTECVNSARYFDINRRKPCDICPHKKERDAFKAQAIETVLEMTGKHFDFDKTLSAFYQIRNMEETTSDKISVKSAVMRGVYFSEKNRSERIKDAERANK